MIIINQLASFCFPSDCFIYEDGIEFWSLKGEVLTVLRKRFSTDEKKNFTGKHSLFFGFDVCVMPGIMAVHSFGSRCSHRPKRQSEKKTPSFSMTMSSPEPILEYLCLVDLIYVRN